ncbi:MAG TPA: anhydro-N-acetylmuramic acid kinase [Telmatospirillum sp.]|nr:anhydro-N-acetylmuramic acid kinase [Telmatospirillum sp.]
MTSSLLSLGLMSGTSLDGVDAALIRTDGERVQEFGACLTRPYPEPLRDRLRGVLGGVGAVADVEREMTLFHAEVVEALLDDSAISRADISVIGFHGHTILHRPDQGQTWQIGDGALLAARSGIAVVNDFRTNDVAAGGQGAPLVPIYHVALADALVRPLAILNLGGVGNVTWIGEDGDLLAFDTGPGNALIDDWLLSHTGRPVDLDGALAQTGQIDGDALRAFQGHPYFAKYPPKSLDRDDFAKFAGRLVGGLSLADGAATLGAFTCAAVDLARTHFPAPPQRWLVCGGGRHNPFLMEGLRRRVDAPVDPVDAVGWDGDALEAQAFAFLAVRSLKGLPLTWPGTTGVARPLGGGRVHRPD